MFVKPVTKRPVEQSFSLGDRQVIYTCDPVLHQTVLVKEYKKY